MAQCTSTATATQTSVLTTNTISTSFSSSLSTAAGSVSTILSPSCASSSGSGSNATCISTTTVTSLSTIAGGITTIQVPSPVTIDVLQTEFKTLFAPCTDKVSSESTSQSPSTSSTPSLVVSSVLSQSTPPPVVFTSQSTSTAADGSVVIQIQTITSTLPVTAVYVPTTVPNTQGQTQKDGSQSSSTNLGPVIGGVVGGIVALVALVAFAWFIIQRRKRWDDIFDKDDQVQDPAFPHRSNRRFSLDVDTEPKPYQYGLVGHVSTPPPHSPPGSPPPSGHSAQLSSDWSHTRATSLTPLMALGASTPAHSASASFSSRPSSANSNQPLRPASEVSYVAAGRPLSNASEDGARPVSNARASWYAMAEPVPLIDLDTRAGSPTSIAEQRRLHLVNAQPLSPTTSVTPSEDRLSPPPAQRRKGHLRTSSKPVVVHTDGGRVDDVAAQGSSSAPPAMPPAYEV